MFTINSHVLLHALEETAKLIPFLFLTYLLLEFIEHKAAEKTAKLTAAAGRFGPLVGGLVGALPQCGFSSSAAGLYAGGLISMGTLIAVFLSTSDEMLPVMLSEKASLVRVLVMLAIKVVSGILVGFLIDLIFRLIKRTPSKKQIGTLCEKERCGCHNGIFLSAIIHTAQIALFIFIFSFVIGGFVEGIGEDKLAMLASQAGIFSILAAGLVGLVPNCAASVILTELFLDGVISTGTVLAGLLAGSGVGLLVLFRVHKNIRENLIITGIVYLSGISIGILVDLVGIVI